MEIQSAPLGRDTKSLASRRNVPVYLERTAHKGVGADLVALLDPGHSTKRSILADTNVSTKLAAVGYYRMFSDIAIMADMSIGHEKHSSGNAGATAPLYRTTVERTIFTNDTIFTDF